MIGASNDGGGIDRLQWRLADPFRKRNNTFTAIPLYRHFQILTVGLERASICKLYSWLNINIKVVGNERKWASGKRKMLGNGLGPWLSRFTYNFV